MKSAAYALLFFVLCLVMNLPWLSMTPLSGTEAHRALTADEMVDSHQWLVPILYGRAYLTKPPLHHWLIAASETIAGHPSLFVWRFPSALNGALLCVITCLFGARWFGNLAGIISGGLTLGMIALWGEHQVADIDATDTLFATLSAFCMVEALFGHARFRRRWIIAAGLAVGATMMTKGHAGLPIIAGMSLYPAICTLRKWRPLSRTSVASANTANQTAAGEITPTEPTANGGVLQYAKPTSAPRIAARQTPASRRAMWQCFRRRLAQPTVWAPLLIGVSFFAVWVIAVILRLKHLHLGFDLSGLIETAKNLHPGTFHQVLLALALPPTIFFFSLPTSLALPLSFSKPIRRSIEGGRRRRMAGALAGAVLISWCICLLSGMVIPRYTYPTIAVMCPLAGIVAVAGVKAGGKIANDWIRGIAIGTAAALGIAGVVLSFQAWKLQHLTFPLSMCALLSTIMAAWLVWYLLRSWRAGWGLIALVVVVSVPFGLQRSFDRTAKSGERVAARVRQIAGTHYVIAQGKSLAFQPEIFFYAHTPTVAYLTADFTPDHIPPGTWLFLRDDEYDDWRSKFHAHLTHVSAITYVGGKTFYLAWYAPEGLEPQ